MKRSQILCVSSMKGGVGKTEVSLNLAYAIRKKTGKRVVVIDLDIPYGGVAQAFAVDKSVSLSDWVRTKRKISEEAMKSIVMQHESGIDFLPAIASAYDVSQITKEDIKRILHQISEFYDYIVIDTGVDFGDITKTALLEADKIVIVTTPSNVSVWNNHAYKEDLLRLGVSAEKLLLFINKVPKKKKMDIEVEQVIQVYKDSGVSVETVSFAYEDDQIRELRNKRGFIYQKNGRNKFSKAINDVVDKLGIAFPRPILNPESTSSNSRWISGFFRRMFAR